MSEKVFLQLSDPAGVEKGLSPQLLEPLYHPVFLNYALSWTSVPPPEDLCLNGKIGRSPRSPPIPFFLSAPPPPLPPLLMSAGESAHLSTLQAQLDADTSSILSLEPERSHGSTPSPSLTTPVTPEGFSIRRPRHKATAAIATGSVDRLPSATNWSGRPLQTSNFLVH